MNFQAAEDLLRQGIAEGAFPCAAFAVGRGREVFVSDVMGDRAVYPAREAADRETLYDMASLSKLMAATMAALRLIEDGKLLLADPLSRYFTAAELDGAPEGRADATVFHLMTHSSGITPHIALWKKLGEPEEGAVVHEILSSPAYCAPGEQVHYSCMGYILLQRILERVTGERLDVLARRLVFDPLGMKKTCYCPTSENVVTTELSPITGEYIKGHVHDENAFFLGGVSGNAGVFAPLDDMIRFAVMCSTRGELPGTAFGTAEGRFLARRTFDAAVTNYTPGKNEERGLGFQLKKPLPALSAAGELMSPGSYGHNGFTGTSLYVDAQTGVWGILLTNSVHFGRSRNAFFRYRRAFYNTVAAGAERD